MKTISRIGWLLSPCLAFVARAAVWHVDDANLTGTATGSAQYPFSAIHAAVAQAAHGDVVKVAEGTYAGFSTLGKGLFLRGGHPGGSSAAYAAGLGGDFSAADPAAHPSVVVGGAGDGVLLTRFDDQPYQAEVSGFTVRAGRRGIVCDVETSWPQPENVSILRNVVEDNGATNGLQHGVGITVGGAGSVVAHNLVRNNRGGRGPGIFRVGDPAGLLRIETNQIVGNVCYDDHGGGLMLHGNVSMVGNLVASNRIELNYGWGGGLIFHTAGALHSERNVYRHNYAPTYGGGVFIDEGATAEMRNDLVYRNSTGEGRGGGIAVDDGYPGPSTLLVANCTVAYNNEGAAGGLTGNGLFVDNNSSATVENSIFHGNGADFFVRDGSSLVVLHTLCPIAWPGAGNRAGDPLFANAAANDFALLDGSPAIEAGTNRAWMATGTDAAGNPRISGARVDLGAFERQASAPPFPSPFPFSAQPLATLHVATNGNDSTGNGSPAQPFRTVGRAAQAAAPGTDIRIHPGTYAGDVNLHNLAGNATNPIWIRAAVPTNRPVFQGGSQGFFLSRARHVALQDLVVAGSSANGINCDDGGDYANPSAAGFLVFSNLLVRDVGGGGNQDGIKLSGIRDFHVYGVEIARCGGNGAGSGIDMVGCHRGVIQGGRFYDLSGNAIQAKGGTSDVEIRQNWISNAGHRGVNVGGSTSFAFFRPPLSTNEPNAEARNVRLYANVFVGSTAAVAFAGAVGCVVANNTIVEPSRWVFRILQETTTSGATVFAPCGNNEFDNNLVYYRHAQLSSFANVGPDTASNTFAVRNNLWYPHDQPAAAPHSLPGTVSGNLHGQNPMLANPAAGDYRLGPASPALAAGRPLADARADFDGIPFWTLPSIGAFENPPRLTIAGTGAQAAFTIFPTAPGRAYRLDHSPQLVPQNWQTATQAVGTGAELRFPAPGMAGGYYRHAMDLP